METIELDKITPADYNPRTLKDDAFLLLKHSIQELGVVKPIIVNKNNGIIIAGHQRTKAMKDLGITHCPAFILNIEKEDEVRFNQLHNRCEYEISDKAPKVKIATKVVAGFQRIQPKDIQIISNGTLGAINNELCRLVAKYGDFGCPIVDMQGNVFVSSAYARASKLCNRPLWVYGAENVDKIIDYMSKTYGEFSYDNLPRTTWQQSYAQMKRLRKGVRANKSTLYNTLVLPYLAENKSLSVLDFGAGQKDYAKMLKNNNYNIKAVDPYHRKGTSNSIDVLNNKLDYLSICDHIVKKGLFDVVVCDSVLNSVDSIEAENNVVNTCRALCKPNGIIFISGRCFEFASYQTNRAQAVSTQPSEMRFFDKDNFSAQQRQGEWFYQKFHDEKQRKALLNIIGKGKIQVLSSKRSSFQIMAYNTNQISVKDALKALMAEFNMPLPNGRSYGLQEKIKEAYLYAISNNKNI